MNIKSLLIGSAAALAAVSGAQAADAIVAAEPEPMEYVRVCDAFGTGFFYIPGTETCLKIGGFVRFQTSFGRDVGGVNGFAAGGHSDWDAYTRAQVNFDARNDTELGTLRSFIALQADSDWDAFTRAHINFDARNDTELGTLRSFIALEVNSDNSDSAGSLGVDEAFIELGGFKVGYFWSWWDSGINGETDTLGTVTRFNSIAYNYDGGTWRAGLSLDEIENGGFDVLDRSAGNDLGVAATVGFSLGGVNLDILGGYDNGAEEGAIRAILSAEVGPGTLQVAGVWASDPNSYWAESEWSVAASYAFKATEKLTITPAAQYFGDVNFGVGTDVDAWRVGLTVGYEIVSGLNFLGTVDYNKIDVAGAPDEDFTRGFLRLQRNF